MKTVYLDYAATTPIDPEVLKAMLPYLNDSYGNASSIHNLGQKSYIAVDKARKQIADFLNCQANQIIFCGSATEANNLAIQGTLKNIKNPHIITTSIEHPSVLNTVSAFKDVTYIPVNKDGIVNPLDIKKAIKENTALISVMYANNEIGTIQPIKEIAEIIKQANRKRKQKIFFHTDAVQAINYLDCNVKDLHVDFLTLSAHKIYGPKGIGALYIKDLKSIQPIILGGNQEFGLRSGTENVPSIVGFGKAIELVKKHKKNIGSIQPLRDFIIKSIPDALINGSIKNRLPNNINASFLGIEGESLLMLLNQKGIYVSTGSACSSKELKPSHVLLALGLDYKRAHGSIRISIGRYTTKEDIKYFLTNLETAIKQLRSLSPY